MHSFITMMFIVLLLFILFRVYITICIALIGGTLFSLETLLYPVHFTRHFGYIHFISPSRWPKRKVVKTSNMYVYFFSW